MKKLFEERTDVGKLTSVTGRNEDVRVVAHSIAYWCPQHHWLVLEAMAYSPQLDDPQHEALDWPAREVLVTRATSQFSAIRIAVDDANAWRARVKEWLKESSR